MIAAFLNGLGLGASLIIAIGAQNAFVISQGLRKQYPIMVAALCAFLDALLILAGVAGLGKLISSDPLWANVMAWGGAAFLFWYGFKSFKNLFSDHALRNEIGKKASRKEIFITTLAITLLNPHVYLDTVVLVGGVGGQFENDVRPYFALGAMISSFLWFFTISLGAAWASPHLARPITWKVIDLITGLVMWSVAASLIL